MEVSLLQMYDLGEREIVEDWGEKYLGLTVETRLSLAERVLFSFHTFPNLSYILK
jgi:hypothetical protein